MKVTEIAELIVKYQKFIQEHVDPKERVFHSYQAIRHDLVETMRRVGDEERSK